MSVTFNREQLIRVATEAISQHRKAAEDYQREVEKFKTDHVAEHGSNDDARRVRDWLTAQLKTGKPVLRQNYYREFRSNSLGDLLYSPPENYYIERNIKSPKGLLNPAELVETKALLQVLQAATGETVSVNELKLLGLKNLQPVFIAAASESEKTK